MPMANQFPGEQQHRDLVSVTGTRGTVGIHVDDVHRHVRGRRQRAEFREHFLAKPAAGARIQQKPQWACRSLPLKDFTEWAMNSTVWAGTSPTAVTWWPCTIVENAYPEPTRARPCMGGSAGARGLSSVPEFGSRCASTKTETVARPSE